MRKKLPAVAAKAEKVLVVRLSAVGDVLHVLPALEALRRLLPRARISWIAEELSAPLLHGHPHLEKVWVSPRKSWERRLRRPSQTLSVAREALGFFRSLRRERFSLVLDFQANLRGALTARLSGASFSVGFGSVNAKEGAHLFHTAVAPPVPPDVHRVERNLALVRFLGYEGPDPGPSLPEFAEEKKWAREQLASFSRPIFLFHPGVSAFGAFKAWREDGFARLALLLKEEFGGTVLLSRGPGDRELVSRIRTLSRSAAREAPECSTLAHLAALLSRSDLLVAPDTGVLHLADALRRPLVALFGPKDPAVYGPRYAPRRIVRSGIPCSPCTKRDCDHRSCMLSITPESVLDAVRELLGEKRHGSR